MSQPVTLPLTRVTEPDNLVLAPFPMFSIKSNYSDKLHDNNLLA